MINLFNSTDLNSNLVLLILDKLALTMADKNLLSEILEANAARPSDKSKDKKKDISKENSKSQEKTSDKSTVSSKAGESSRSLSDKKKEANENDGLSKLGEIFKTGLLNMNKTMASLGDQIAEKICGELKPMLEFPIEDEDFSEERFEDEPEEAELLDNEDVLQSISKEFGHAETLGPEVSNALGKLVDTLLSTKASEEVVKAREARHLKPKNVKFVECPQVNKQVLFNMKRNTRSIDMKMQGVQREFLKSAIPITKVIDTLHAEYDKGTELDLPSLIKNLSDSLAFLGSANVEMVKCRRENIKGDIPQKMKGICSADAEFSASLLFGDKFLQTIKEVSEEHKVTQDMRQEEQAPASRGGTARYRPYFRRGSAGRFNRGRYSPYSRRGSFLSRRGYYQSQTRPAQRSRLVSRKN